MKIRRLLAIPAGREVRMTSWRTPTFNLQAFPRLLVLTWALTTKPHDAKSKRHRARRDHAGTCAKPQTGLQTIRLPTSYTPSFSGCFDKQTQNIFVVTLANKKTLQCTSTAEKPWMRAHAQRLLEQRRACKHDVERTQFSKQI